jgi:hypothetical protein
MKALSRTLLLASLLTALGIEEVTAQPPPADPLFQSSQAPVPSPGAQLPPPGPPTTQAVPPPPPSPVVVAAAPAPQRQPAQGPLRRLRTRVHNFFHPGDPI